MTKINFTVDPVFLTKRVLMIYAEKVIMPSNPSSIFLSIVDFINESSDKDIEDLVREYVEKENLAAVTFKDWHKDCKSMLDILSKRQSFKTKVIKHHMEHGGETGYGVYDKKQIKFFDCNYTQHFEMIMKIVEESYPKYIDALRYMWAFPNQLKSFDGIKNEDIEDFLQETFEFVGLSEYSKNILGLKEEITEE